jgi:hypothetical protein
MEFTVFDNGYFFFDDMYIKSWSHPREYIKIICRRSNLRCFLFVPIDLLEIQHVFTRYVCLPSSGVEKSKELWASVFHIWKRMAITATVNWTSVSSSSSGSSRARGPVAYGHETRCTRRPDLLDSINIQ